MAGREVAPTRVGRAEPVVAGSGQRSGVSSPRVWLMCGLRADKRGGARRHRQPGSRHRRGVLRGWQPVCGVASGALCC